MNRRALILGALAGSALLSLRSAALPAFAQDAQTPTPPADIPIPTDGCIYPIGLMNRTEALITDIRGHLAAHDLRDVPDTIGEFYARITDQYAAAFGLADSDENIGILDGELDEAAEILNDPACYVATPPEEGCMYYEAWKYFYHREAMALFPADGSVPFNNLSEEDQYRVAEGTVAYAGMLQNIFGSLITHYGMDVDLSVLTSHLYLANEDMGVYLATAGKDCPRMEQPTPDNMPMLRDPVPTGPIIRLAYV